MRDNETIASSVRAYLLTALLCAAGCASPERMSAPPSGLIASPGGAPGYQHGADRTQFSVGTKSRRLSERGYSKLTGKEGTLAIDQINGSAYAVPKAGASAQQSLPYGKSPAEHDAFVADYFRTNGVAAAQVGRVQGRMMLETTGRADERERAAPKVTAYYSVLQRTVDGIAVPDSFAWARVNAEGQIVEEAVYWPAISRQTLEKARQLREAWSDEVRRRELANRIHGDDPRTVVAIRHSSASSHDAFEAFASIDVYQKLASPRTEQQPKDSSAAPQSQVNSVRHFDIDGAELRLPQERFVLDRKSPDRKVQPASATERSR